MMPNFHRYLVIFPTLFVVGHSAVRAHPAESAVIAVTPYTVLLPSTPGVKAVLEQHPAVQQVQQRALAQQSYAQGVRVGNGEFSVRVSGQQRSATDSALNTRDKYREYAVSVERPLRWPHQVSAAHKLAESMDTAAKYSVVDAQHEAARSLLAAWYAVLRAESHVQTQQSLVTRTAQQLAATQRRASLGDAAQMEVDIMQGELSRAQAAVLSATGQADSARQSLQSQFPQVGLPSPRALAASLETTSLQALPKVWRAEDEAAWLQRYLAHSHEVQLSQAEVELSQRQAQRSHAERLPEPTVGVFYANERAGNEKVLGVSLSMPFNLPFGATPRSAKADAAAYEAQSAQYRHAKQLQQISQEFATLLSNARHRIQSAHALQNSYAQQVLVTQKLQRAYSLGETSLSEVRLAQKTLVEVQLTARQALLDAHESVARLALDQHQLWDFEE